MAVIIGSARLGENGRITGGKSGDQTGSEVATQNYYVHSKGWRVLRAKDAAARKKIATAMRAACKNNNIGYDQNSRNSLYSLAAKVGFDVSKVTAKCETDCSALVRVCCAFAGIKVKDFITSNEASVLLASGAFSELTGDKYTKQSAYLAEGDILVTKTKGHTVVVLTDGSKVEVDAAPESFELGERILKNGMEGMDVAQLQEYLNQLGCDCGKVDGDFGDNTEMGVRKFQKKHSLEVDGEYGPKSHAALEKALADVEKPVDNPRYVKIVNGDCYVRTAPNTSGKKLGTAYKGDKFNYGGEVSSDGWHLIEFDKQNGWVSGKYSELEG